VIVLGGLGGLTIAMGADGDVPYELALTVTNWVDPPVMLVIPAVVYVGFVVVAVNVPAVMAIRTSCSAGTGTCDPRAF
jgi:hypothetical protein